MGGGYLPETLPQALGAASVLMAFVNVSGGFVVTKRMLDMFKRAYTLTYLENQLFYFRQNMLLILLLLFRHQGPVTHQSIPGCMQSPVSFLEADISRLRPLEWRV